MTIKTQDDEATEQGSDPSAEKVCERCGNEITSDDYFEKRLPTSGRKYRHEDCHEEACE